jgi:hypothetical protein
MFFLGEREREGRRNTINLPFIIRESELAYSFQEALYSFSSHTSLLAKEEIPSLLHKRSDFSCPTHRCELNRWQNVSTADLAEAPPRRELTSVFFP